MGAPENKSSETDTLVSVLVVIAILLLAAIGIPRFIKARSTSSVNACINNLREVDGAINEWAMENHKTAGDTPTWNDIKPYMRLNSTGDLPKCPEGGKYTLGKVGDIHQVTCSIGTNAIPWHILP